MFSETLPHDHAGPALALPLTAEECRRSRLTVLLADGREVKLAVPRGTVLRAGDRLRDPETGEVAEVVARPEPVMTVRAPEAHALLKGAYHLGNRHVMLEVGPDYLRLAPDPVLAQMVAHLGLSCQEEVAPFQPEAGAYHSHSHAHAH